jgi:hypothetical protein
MLHVEIRNKRSFTWICQSLHHFMHRIGAQTHLTSLTSQLIRRVRVLSQLQCLERERVRVSTKSKNVKHYVTMIQAAEKN